MRSRYIFHALLNIDFSCNDIKVNAVSSSSGAQQVVDRTTNLLVVEQEIIWSALPVENFFFATTSGYVTPTCNNPSQTVSELGTREPRYTVRSSRRAATSDARPLILSSSLRVSASILTALSRSRYLTCSFPVSFPMGLRILSMDCSFSKRFSSTFSVSASVILSGSLAFTYALRASDVVREANTSRYLSFESQRISKSAPEPLPARTQLQEIAIPFASANFD